MGSNCSIEVKSKDTPLYVTRYDRLNKIDSVFLRDIVLTHEDYHTANKILNERTLNQYGNMMRNSSNMGF